MSEIDDLGPLRDVIARFDLSAKRSLGQNFLLDINLTRRIARSAGSLENTNIIEIGPGPGALTRALLLEDAAEVIAIERDSRCINALEELKSAAQSRLTVISDDALKVDMAALSNQFKNQNLPVKVIANLPYNISTVLLVKWLQTEPWPPWYESLTLLFQKEVAARIVAQPHSKAYGRLSVLTQWRAYAKTLFDIDPRAFTPPPKVFSTLVQIKPRNEPLCPVPSSVLQEVTATMFGQRRKMIRSSLAGLGENVEALLASAGIKATERPEDLDINQFCALTQALIDIRRQKTQ